jgi:hypothetical protein
MVLGLFVQFLLCFDAVMNWPPGVFTISLEISVPCSMPYHHPYHPDYEAAHDSGLINSKGSLLSFSATVLFIIFTWNFSSLKTFIFIYYYYFVVLGFELQAFTGQVLYLLNISTSPVL